MNGNRKASMSNYKIFRESNYKVFDNGIIETIGHTLVRSNGRKHTVKDRVLKPAKDNKGYLRVGLMIKGHLRTFKIHRMVAECFIPNPNMLPQINHKDGNKENNCVLNLEWVNNSQNIKHAFATGLIKNIYGQVSDKSNFPRGEKNHESKLTAYNVITARDKRKTGQSFQSIANEYGVCKKTIMQAIKGNTWKHL